MLNTLKTVITGLFDKSNCEQDPMSSFKLTRNDLVLLRSQIKLLSETRRSAKRQSKELSRMCNKHFQHWQSRRDSGHHDNYSIIWKTGMAASAIKLSGKVEARHKHIAYCLLRGKKYNQIEKCSDGNGVNVDYLHQIMLPFIPYQLNKLFTIQYLDSVINGNGDYIK